MVAQAEGGCTHKHRAGSPAVPFAHGFTTTPVNRRSHARQGVPRIWAFARQAGSDVGLITVDIINVDIVPVQLIHVQLNNVTPNGCRP